MLKILFADDEPIVIEGLKLMVDWDKLGIEIVGAASNGEMALEMIKRLKPDIVLTDIQMPCITGIELLAICAEKKYRAKCVMLTSYGELDYVRSAMKYGALQYLMKPLEPEEIEKTMNEISAEIYAEREKEQETRSKIKAVTQETFQRILFGEKSEHLYSRAGFILGADVNKPLFVTILRARVKMDDADYAAFKSKIKPFMYEEGIVRFSVGDNTHIFIDSRVENYERTAISEIGSEYFTGVYTILINGISELAAAYSAAAGRFAMLSENTETIQLTNNMTDVRVTADAEETLKLAINRKDKEALEKIDEDFRSIERNGKIAYAAGYVSALLISMCRYSNPAGINMEGLFDEALSAVGNAYDINTYRLLCRECLEQYITLTSNIESLDIVMMANDIISYMKENCGRKLTISSISKELHLNSALISKMIKENTGMKFNDYLNFIRIQNAKQLIMNTNTNITQIALETGYNDYYYFTSKFKELTGELPSDYRKARRR